jgi:hypothetical protein
MPAPTRQNWREFRGEVKNVRTEARQDLAETFTSPLTEMARIRFREPAVPVVPTPGRECFRSGRSMFYQRRDLFLIFAPVSRAIADSFACPAFCPSLKSLPEHVVKRVDIEPRHGRGSANL